MPLSDLMVLFGKWIDLPVFPVAGRRWRVFPLAATFWLFLSQVLTAGTSCSESVRKMAAVIAALGAAIPPLNMSAYCQARKHLPLECLLAIFAQTKVWLAGRARRSWH